MKCKYEFTNIFVAFKAQLENLFDTKIKVLRTDGGGEYIGSYLHIFLQNHGIVHQFSCPHTPEQNRVAKRKHRHITETCMTLLAHSNAPSKYWFEAFNTATYLINRMPLSRTSLKSSFELLFQKPPEYTHLKVFGCLCFPCLSSYRMNKLEFKSKPYVFWAIALLTRGIDASLLT